MSDADRESQRASARVSRSTVPQDGFLGEEGGDDTPGVSGLQWVVDPLDGTVNFLFGLPQWCVSVAVRDARGVIAGAIYDPTREQLFIATRGGRATLVGEEREDRAGGCATRRAPARATWRVRWSRPASPTTRACAPPRRGCSERVLPRVRDIRRFGSAALDLAWTAAGRYDAYFERTVKPWDIAAGTLLCEAVGLRVVDLPPHEDLPWGILVAPPALCEPLLELVG